jgi:hypothetical protein
MFSDDNLHIQNGGKIPKQNKTYTNIDESKLKECGEINPIKVIYKYKNNNRKDIYLTYIYVGQIGKKCDKIFSKIENLDIFNTLMILTKEDEIKIKELLGKIWIDKLFNRHHILNFIKKISSSKNMNDKIKSKYGVSWMDEFKARFESNILFKKMNYSYGEFVKNEYREKMGKKIEKLIIDKDDYDNEYKKVGNLLEEIKQLGGEVDNQSDLGSDKSVNIDDDDDDNDAISFVSENEESIEYETKSDNTNELSEDDIIKLYQTEDKDENLKKTNAMITSALQNTKIIEHKTDYMIKFDTTQDNDIENDNLANVHKKKFVYTHFLFKDDNVKTIKNKLCSTIKINKKFSDELFLTPSKIYLWSEYLIDTKLEKVMIGQRWVKKNDLLKINVEPYILSEYENLSINVKKIKNILEKNESKIKREEEDNNILHDYDEFILNDTIYMIDIYNELGENYDSNNDQMKNVTDIYLKLYFPKIRGDEIRELISFLNKKDKIEEKSAKDIFDTIYNDVLLEKEVTEIVEKVRISEGVGCKKIFEDKNYITQSSIHVSLKIKDKNIEEENKEIIEKVGKLVENTGALMIPKLDLFRIFNNFDLEEKYPFIQYQVPNGQIIFKYLDDYMHEFSKTKENIEILTKWFENSPYGISFKVKFDNEYTNDQGEKVKVERFMAININEIGKVIYKTHHKEIYNTSISDVENTYEYVRDLVKKINKILEKDVKKMSIKIPQNFEFKFDFINSNQKFKLPVNKIINHNDLSDFCVFFYPFISLVIEPKKRVGKIESKNDTSKYGTYLRFKRVSKYENQGKIEQRILSYIRNFNFEDDILVEEISKQFNLTTDKAKEEIVRVRKKFPNVVKGKKMQYAKTNDMPKFKPSGIEIDIQGKTPDKYKIKISGARNQYQLTRMMEFVNILLFLYSEVYLVKNPKYIGIKDKLKKITNIAKRRNKVNEIVNYEKDSKKLKEMVALDKKRLGYSSEDSKNQWARLCQNSGKFHRKRPLLTTSDNISKLISSGYSLNKKTGEYEKKVLFKQNGKKNEIILKALKVTSSEENASGNEIYYSCDPDENGEHMFIGFLTKTLNPFGECMPCCYKKNPFTSKQKEKVLFHEKCLHPKKQIEDTKESKNTKKEISNEILYILQDSNKTGENRISYLPSDLNLITNYNLNRTNEIRNHYLLKTDGYFFRCGIDIENYSFLNTLSNVVNLTHTEIKNKITKLLKNNDNEMLYYSLNDGDIRYEFRVNDFINFINEREMLEYYYLKDLMKIPGLFTKNGIYCIIFDKNLINGEFYLDIDEYILNDFEHNKELIDNKDILILMKEKKYYFPIVEIIKKDDIAKEINVNKLFNKNNDHDTKLIDIVKDFFVKTVEDTQIDYKKDHVSTKDAYKILMNIKNDKFTPTHQVIDTRFKCKFIITKEKYIIPVSPSGVVSELAPVCFNMNEQNHDCFSKIKFNDIETTNKYLEEIYKLSNKRINVKPYGLFYDDIDKKGNVGIVGIKTINNDIVPVQKILIDKKQLEENGVSYENRPLYYMLDQKLSNYSKEKFDFVDDRIKNINEQKYYNEGYQLFRFELSNILSNPKMKKYKDELKKYIEKEDYENIQILIRKICIDTKTLGKELIKIIEELPDLIYYKINNQRILCDDLSEDDCINNKHCYYNGKSKNTSKNKCYYAATEKNINKYVKKLSYEITEQKIKANELLNENKYYVSDIVDYNLFTYKPGQTITKSSNTNLNKILKNIFGDKHIPQIGKRYLSKKTELDLDELQSRHPLKDIKDSYSQTIVPYNYSVVRAYINCYYWNKHSLYTMESRNLGYYSLLQTKLLDIFKSLIIDWLNVSGNIDIINSLDETTKNNIKNKFIFDKIDKGKINNYVINLMENPIEENNGLFELLILNNIHKITIILMTNGEPKFQIHNNKVTSIKNNKDYSNYLSSSNLCINIDHGINNKSINIVESIFHK